VRTNAELLERHIEQGRLGEGRADSAAIQDILGETDRLGRMVGQMLTLAQADAGQPILTEGDVALDELAAEVGRSLRALAEAKGLTLDVQTVGQTWVRGDRERLREVLVTLVDNAIKYTEDGRVGIAVTRSGRKAAVTVSDTGVGIPASDLPHIFERFYRVNKARSRDDGGTGLGMAIARHIVEAHGGSIRAESKPGEGTLITVELRALAHSPSAEASRMTERGVEPPAASP
jgi:signal transduction histidine kinase